MAVSRPEWHNTADVNTAVENYYHKYCMQPDSTEAKQSLQRYLDTIDSYLKEQGYHPQAPQYAGSTYEGLKVDDGLEFDVMIIIDGGKAFDVVTTDVTDFVRLKANPGLERDYLKSSLVDGYVSAKAIARKFQSLMSKLYNQSPEFQKDGVTFRKHGPAMQMDVQKDGRFWYSVDLVPAFAVDGQFYVAKGRGKRAVDWRRSFSVQMKEVFANLDGDNGRRKQVLRTLKVIFQREHVLSSHHLKMLLLAEMEDHPKKTWSPSELAPRLLDLIARLQRYLEEDNFPHYYMPKVNLIGHFKSPATRNNMLNRMRNLYKKRASFMKMLKKTQ